jgi:hypothetical protein
MCSDLSMNSPIDALAVALPLPPPVAPVGKDRFHSCRHKVHIKVSFDLLWLSTERYKMLHTKQCQQQLHVAASSATLRINAAV